MILFCDTSALIKCYLCEEHSQQLKHTVTLSDGVAVCRIAWAEAHAAFARRAREIRKDTALLEQAKIALQRDWPHYIIMETTQAVVEHAGELAETFALRGYDSVQLAAANTLFRKAKLPVTFACFDRHLNKAAKMLGLKILD